uniref:Uncharacterized protein n=1 Tax=Oryza glumipatula TaxID=40148 RepID=A0A0D9Y960_9ORYZ
MGRQAEMRWHPGLPVVRRRRQPIPGGGELDDEQIGRLVHHLEWPSMGASPPPWIWWKPSPFTSPLRRLLIPSTRFSGGDGVLIRWLDLLHAAEAPPHPSHRVHRGLGIPLPSANILGPRDESERGSATMRLLRVRLLNPQWTKPMRRTPTRMQLAWGFGVGRDSLAPGLVVVFGCSHRL